MNYAKDTLDVFEPLTAGESRARIVEIVCLGDQPTKAGDKTIRKYHIGLEFEDGRIEPLSRFGIANFGGASQHPFVGFFELYTAVLGHEPTNAEQRTLDKYEALLGKTIVVVIEDVMAGNGNMYANITGVKASDVQIEGTHELIAFHREDIADPDKVWRLESNVADMVKKSIQYAEYQLGGKVVSSNAIKETPMPIIDLDAPKEEINIKDVPF